jgi:hypothetical protein
MAGSVNPQNPNAANLLQALFLVLSVHQDLQALLPQAQAQGSVTVSVPQLQGWIRNLQRALDLLNRIAVILIFPPPPIVGFVETARNQITIALNILKSVPTTRSIPGEGQLSFQALQTAISALQQAEVALVQAIRSA